MSSAGNQPPITPAAQLMAIEVISGLLVSTSPHKLGETLTEHLRELTGARTVIVLVHRPEPCADKLLYASPQRRSTLFSAVELNLFCHEKTPGELPLRPEEFSADHPLHAPLLKAGVRSMARYPLRVGGELIAQVLLFDLPDIGRIAETSQIMNLLAAPIALALKNALALRLIEAQAQELEQRVEERTAELRQSEQRYHSILRAAMDGICLTDEQGHFVEVNETYCHMSGYSMQELLTMSIADVEYLETAEDIASRIEKIRAQGEDRFESQHRRKDGSVYDVEVSIQYRSADGGQFVAFLRDISERKQVQLALRQKNHELERFVYSVSHDLKSPLITIRTFLPMLQQDLQDGDRQQINEDLHYIDKAAGKMHQMLEALLRYSRIGRKDAPAQTLAVGQQVEDCLTTLAGILRQQQIQVTIGELPYQLHGDPIHFAQVWQNLIENAVKYMGDQAQPQIEVGALQQGQDVVFYVRDNGMGIEPAHSERVFNLFSQLNPESDGSGLGLALVKKIVSIYRGRIWVESAGAGTGSCFMFTLPGAK